jgi:emfourin
MTKISFKKSGGIMGREVESNIDLNEMPENESQEIQRMILDSNFFNIPQNLIEPSGHDEYEYTITVDAGNSHHTVHTTDSSAPESLQPFLEKLSALAKEGNSRPRTA